MCLGTSDASQWEGGSAFRGKKTRNTSPLHLNSCHGPFKILGDSYLTLYLKSQDTFFSNPEILKYLDGANQCCPSFWTPQLKVMKLRFRILTIANCSHFALNTRMAAPSWYDLRVAFAVAASMTRACGNQVTSVGVTRSFQKTFALQFSGFFGSYFYNVLMTCLSKYKYRHLVNPEMGNIKKKKIIDPCQLAIF